MSYAIYPSLNNKVVVITGGGTGIGAAMVEAFSAQGACVHFLDVADEPSLALVEACRQTQYEPVYHRCDLRDIDALQRCFDAIAQAAGDVQILVNNAANDDRHDVGDVSAAYWDDRLAVNLRHQFFCAQAVVDGMRKQGAGAIVNLGSISWHLATPNLSVYMTAKAGIEGLTRGLARDLGEYGIRVNCVIPGAVRTPRQMKLWQSNESESELLGQQCLHARIEPEHVARMVLFLASDDAACCTGRDYFVDAGWYGT
ncbi:SDR family NAD(P)-dependent oxidoreductase [Paraburkholderia tropica]|uniref:SDR family NAD(P)-dependent oxidoreductase n=1 Tax=Paraburkholderia tropica TaxID=92647 RepID=UPI002AB6DC3B|nr:SDR family oxidoreductase [Paraburkholderia tropica]